jgi:hypothetical protein
MMYGDLCQASERALRGVPKSAGKIIPSAAVTIWKLRGDLRSLWPCRHKSWNRQGYRGLTGTLLRHLEVPDGAGDR